jgi:menaquinone-dependent protoporphyrinogen oxidase
MSFSKNGGRYLVAYATNAGSTAEIARVIAEELARMGVPVDVRRVEDVESLADYSAAVVGGPMMVGWHRAAIRFIKRHHQALSRMPVAYFFAAISLTQPKDDRIGSVPVFTDPMLAKPLRNPERPSLRERYATLPNYLTPVLKAAPRVRPVRAAFFAGKLDLSILNPLCRLFLWMIMQARAGDYRNWKTIRAWASALPPEFAAHSAGGWDSGRGSGLPGRAS